MRLGRKLASGLVAALLLSLVATAPSLAGTSTAITATGSVYSSLDLVITTSPTTGGITFGSVAVGTCKTSGDTAHATVTTDLTGVTGKLWAAVTKGNIAAGDLFWHNMADSNQPDCTGNGNPFQTTAQTWFPNAEVSNGSYQETDGFAVKPHAGVTGPFTVALNFSVQAGV